ncbi:MAG: DNA polymerase IV [Dethiobacteria bacterium]|nr:DNA polymerase IV [Dethiobacteria bacterium]
MKGKIIFLADMESFYASVETARNPALRGKPVAVCGDPALRHGIILAASREAKAFGVKTGQPAWEARRMCPWTHFVHPHMQLYIDYSMRITKIFENYTDRVFPYSIDEQFLDLSGLKKLFGSPLETAAAMIRNVWDETGIRCRIGMGENLLQAKMACDRFAKKSAEAFFELNSTNYAACTWPLPIGSLFGVGHRMERNLQRIGVRTIGHLAGLPRDMLQRRWGLNGELLWLNAHGIDYSTIEPGTVAEQKGIGHTATLPRDYRKQGELELVLLEMTEEVCYRTRQHGKIGATVHLYCKGADFDFPTGFSRQKKLPEPSALAPDIYPTVRDLFRKHWDQKPVRAVGISLTGLSAYRQLQLTRSNRYEKEEALTTTADMVRERYGKTSLFRASSLAPGAQLFQRAGKIGGHDA